MRRAFIRSCMKPLRMPSSISTVYCEGVPSSSMVSEPRRSAMVPSSTTVTPGAATRCPIRPANAEVFLRLKSPSRPWPIASCSRMPGQPGPSTTVISPAGAGIEFEVDQSLSQRLIHGLPPGRRIEIAVIGDPAAGAVGAGLLAAVLLDDDGDVQPHQRPDIVQQLAARPDHPDRLPLAGERGDHLANPPVLAARIGIHIGEQPCLRFEGNQRQRVEGAVEGAIGARRRLGEGSAVTSTNAAHGIGGASYRLFAQVGAVREAGDLARHRPQAEALGGIEAGALQMPVVEDEAFGLSVFQEQLAVVGLRQRLADDAVEPLPIEFQMIEEDITGVGGRNHFEVVR